MIVNITIIGRRWVASLAMLAAGAMLFPGRAEAQAVTPETIHGGPLIITDSALRKQFREDSARVGRGRFYRRFAGGFATSILLHETAHYASSYVMGFHPHFGFDKGRPTAFSGIDEVTNRREQFIFSAAGLVAQDILDELVIDVPHKKGGAFERGLLAGGVGTTLFYVTIGRNARVSDITVMDRTSNLSRAQLSLIFGSVAAAHALRMSRDRAYTHFFVAPIDRGKRLSAGLTLKTR